MKPVLQIAKEVLKENIDEEGYSDIKARCLDISNDLAEKLQNEGYEKVYVVQGTFYVDDPDMSQWDDSTDEEMTYHPLHYWVEVDGLLLDITGKQFQDEVEGEELEDIVYGTYDEYSRYVPMGKKKIS